MKQAHLRKGVYWHIFPTYGEAKDSVWRDPAMLFDIIPEQLIARKNETELVVYLKNGSLIQLKGADDPDALRGPNPMGIVFDEFDKQKIDAWYVLEPILRANGGWAWFIGTPIGKQNLFTFYNRGQKEDREWKSWILRASESGIIPYEDLENSKEELKGKQGWFEQEYECAFNEAAGNVFRGVREIMLTKPKPPERDHFYVMGVDLAKVKDWTVLRVYDRDTNCLVYKDRFQTLEWPFQKAKIATVAKHYNNALAVIDATGVGDPICDDLIRAGVGVIPFKISQITKKDIIEKLSTWIETRRIKFLMEKFDPEMLDDYDNFTYDVGPLGKIRYGAREGKHDDVVMADALAVWHLNPVYMPDQMREPTPTQVMFARHKQQYENNQRIIEDGEDEFASFGDSSWTDASYEESGYQ